ncbi:MAG: HNH endonuclease [Pseudomonadales bacterium]|nr:HNH endonuclease [Pseudomonadales bacterium]
MQFTDGYYIYKLISATTFAPNGYHKLHKHEVGHGALAKYLIAKSEGCPIFKQTLEMFLPKTEDLVDPYWTDLNEAYQRELTTRLAGLDVCYRCQSHGLLKAEDQKPILPWGSGGGGVAGGPYGEVPSGEFDHLEPSIRAHMEQMKRIGNAHPISNPKPIANSSESKSSTLRTSSQTLKGTYKSKSFDMPDMALQEISYTKRDRTEYKELRKDFSKKGGVRETFLKTLAADDSAKLLEAGLTEKDLVLMQNGRVPEGDWAVHHKIPIDDGGDNSLDNLVLIKNKPSHHALTTYQKQQTKGLKPGDTKKVEWPVPNGKIYPKTPKSVSHPNL